MYSSTFHSIIWGDIDDECGPAGVEMVNTTRDKTQPKIFPKSNDVTFLLVGFLKERFPNGGLFRTASRDKFPDSTEDLQGFVKFCERSEYIGHPNSERWCSLLGRAKPITAVLEPNISLYRDCGKERPNV